MKQIFETLMFFAFLVIFYGCKNNSLSNRISAGNKITHDSVIFHYGKFLTEEQIHSEISQIAGSVFFFDSVYVLRFPHVPEHAISTYSVVNSDTWLIFKFFQEKKECTSPVGAIYDPDGKMKLHYL